MTIPVGETLTDVGAAMVASAPDDWAQLRLSATKAGSMIETRFKVVLSDGTIDTKRGTGRAGRDACDRLRTEMYQPGKGTWYTANFVVERSSMKVEADFDYDGRPFNGNATDELMLKDQAMYPRDSEHLPDWHPARER